MSLKDDDNSTALKFAFEVLREAQSNYKARLEILQAAQARLISAAAYAAGIKI